LKYRNLHVVFGAVSDKNLNEIFELLPVQARYYFTEINSARSQKNEVFREYAEAKGMGFETYFKSTEAFAAAKASAGKNDLILICGSFYLLAEVL
jgi:dihydrofolate synthase/folylpolyglutamate synthase